MPADWPRTRALWVLSAIGAGGVLLRQAGLQNWSYWLDEAMQVSYVRGSLKEAFQAVRFDGVHPPLDYFFTWLVFHSGGGRERVLRLLPALWTILACVAVFVLAGGAKRPVRSLGAALFLAATPLSVYLGQEIRPYALALLLVAVAFALLEPDDALADDTRVVLAAIVGVMACMTPYFALVPLAVLWASVLWRASRTRERSRVLRAVLAALPALVVLAAWLWSVQVSLVHTNERFPVNLNILRLVSLFNGLLGWREESANFLMGALIAALMIGVGAVAAVRARDGRHLLAALGTTLGVITLLALTHHWINLRYLALALIPLGVLFGEGVEAFSRANRRAPLVIAVLFVGLHMLSYRENYRSARPNWRQVATYLEFQREQGRAGSIVGLDDWSYLCLRVQPLIAGRVTGFVTGDNVAQVVGANGWLVRTPHYQGAFDSTRLTEGIRPWARCPEAEDARVYRFVNGKIVNP